MNPAALISPARDLITYRRLTLDNGLRVMLTSNPLADRSAAALAVGAGSLDDPPGRPGMAHFLEHMLFLGTERYPEPGAYTRYMASHDGSSNAYTADDHTNYFFSVAHDAFEEGLDRFAWFFIAPLFDQEYTEREFQAVDAEHAKNLENDIWRIRQVQRSIFKSDHPINRFSTGNAETLRSIQRQELLDFYAARYSANRMTLSVVGRASLDELEELVRGRFEQVANRNAEAPVYPERYLEEKSATRLLQVVPVRDQRSLLMHFPLPSMRPHYKARPVSIVASVLGHEGKGSLLSFLKKEDLATGLSAHQGEGTSGYASLDLRIQLTEKGLGEYMRVVELVMGVIKSLRTEGIARHIYTEYSTMAALGYKYRAAQDSAQQARSFSALMQSLPLEELPEVAYLIPEYRPDLYAEILERLIPSNLLLTLISRDQPTDSTERYYGTQYQYSELDEANYQTLLSVKAPEGWHLPTPNAFIPRSTEPLIPDGPLMIAGTTLHHLHDAGMPPKLLKRIAPLQGVVSPSFPAFSSAMEEALPDQETFARWLPNLTQDALPLPTALLDTPQAKVWFMPDWRLRQPKASLRLLISTPGSFATPRAVMLSRLHASAFAESLNEAAYPVREAGLSFSLSPTKQGYLLNLGGYADRMLDLLDYLAPQLSTANVDQATFAALVERTRRGLDNQRFSQPYQQVRTYRKLLMTSPIYSHEALLKALDEITLADVQAHAKQAFQQVYVQGVAVGSLHPDAVREGIIKALHTLDADVLPVAERVDEQVHPLPAEANQVFSQKLEVANSLVHVHYDAGASEPTLRGALLILGRHLGEDFYFNMRTQQQLGYIVWAGMGQTRKRLSLYFLVQSGQYGVDELTPRIETFLQEYPERFAALDETRFEKYRQAVVRAKLDRPKNLGELSERLFWRAFRNDEKFAHVSEDIAAVQVLTRAQVQAVLEEVLQPPQRKRLQIHLVGKEHKAARPAGKRVTLPDTVLGAVDKERGAAD